ncbi:MAG: DUF1592 domain-containing protein [Phycisphaerae bacterium]|nr:DUF1592 domain-containing protein [Phycisphaerae bacterium]
MTAGPWRRAHITAIAVAAVSLWAFGNVEQTAIPAAPRPDVDVASVIDRYCLDCHSETRPKAGFSLEGARDPVRDLDPAKLRILRDRFRRHDMPPEGEPGPSNAEYAAVVAALDRELDRRAEAAPPGRTTLRRLNRVEFRNSVRALTGVDVAVASALPADDVGEGFDHIGDVLSMSPVLLEKYFDIAERTALQAWPDRVERTVITRAASELEVQGGGRVTDRLALVWSAGAAVATFDVPRAGRYRLRVDLGGDQAGGEPVKVAFVVGKKRVAHFDIPERRQEPGARTADVALEGGTQRVGVEFLNDFFDEKLPEGKRDRNLVVAAMTLDGPIDTAAPTRELRALAGDDPAIDAFVDALLPRAFRRPVTDEERAEFAATVAAAVGPEAGSGARVRAAITAALVDPRFLFRVERDPEPGNAERALSPHELATRLSYACWSSSPDAELLAAAGRGELGDDASLARELQRLLDDPRSIALAEHFGQQWLLVRAIEGKELDPGQFPGATPALLGDMKAETTLFLDRMLRENRPLRELLTADWTYLNRRLAEHYGIDGVDGDWLRPVHVGDARVPGLLGHGSVAVATSNPTRTSPVKRGKWVLEALLDAPPPPPPPGVPALAEREARGTGRSMREMLAAHRADPGCASCHVRMDGLGLVLETIDPVGRERATIDGAAIDAKATLPGIGTIDGPRALAAALSNDPDVVRSIVRHMYVYLLGRAMTTDDEPIVDRIARSLSLDATFRDVIRSIVLSRPFRHRAAAKEAA